jgi:uncharacterized membrane protein
VTPTPLTKRLFVLLAISVALNLVLIGFLVGRRVHPAGREGPPPGLEQRHGELGAGRRAIHHAGSEVVSALTAEPFDAPRLERALAELRRVTVGGQEAAHRALVEVATRSSPEERRRLAQRFSVRRERHP